MFVAFLIFVSSYLKTSEPKVILELMLSRDGQHIALQFDIAFQLSE